MKFFGLHLTITLIFISLISCTKEKEVKVSTKMFGQFKYIEAKSEDKNLLAEFNDIKITNAELLKKSKVIQELNQQEEDIYSILVYRAAITQLEEIKVDKKELKDSYELTIYTPEPKEGFDQLATRIKLKRDELINVSFVEPDQQLQAEKVMGLFEGNKITFDNLEKNHVRYIEILTQKFDESLRQVKGILTRKLLFSDAKAKKMSVQDLINGHIVKEPVQVTSEDVVQFMRSKNISDEEMTEQLTSSFKNILLENKKNKIIEKYVSESLANGTVKIYSSSPKVEFNIKPDWSPLYGSETASNSIYFFTNPNCSVCAKMKNNIMTALQSSTYDVKLHAFYFFPDWDREARMFSESAMCIFSEDKSKFWSYHNLLVDFEGKVAESNLYEFAQQVDVDEAKFKSCFLERKNKEVVDYHLKYADYLGINSQPTLIVKGRIYPGTISTEKLLQIFNNNFVTKQKPSFITRVVNYIKNLFS